MKGWRIYNEKYAATWYPMALGGIHQMQREVPIYTKSCVP